MSAATDLLTYLLGYECGAFALLYRPETTLDGSVDVLLGDLWQPTSLAEIPLPCNGGGSGYDVLALIPYRQIVERGFPAPDDGAPLVALRVTAHQRVPLAEIRRRIPDVAASVSSARFTPDDEQYAATVRTIITDEIGAGEGANFVVKRSFLAEIDHYSVAHALAFFRRLLDREQGTYWSFLIHVGDRTLVGATPERHITLRAGEAVMNPISGTYRYPPGGPTLQGVIEFLADRKEAEELYMVVDEELKMMARVCDSGVRLRGPHLKEMASLAHTEYLLEGRTTRDVREILQETMFAPTVTGSPLESAARVIRKYEPNGRGYYSGVAALIGRDADGMPMLDSAILIRTADIDAVGRLRIDVGATIVRHSDPAAETAETRAKAAGLLNALKSGSDAGWNRHPSVLAALERRNARIASFWLNDGVERSVVRSSLPGLRVLIIDAEDTFTEMIAYQLRELGPSVTVRRFDERYDIDGYDLVLMGPGPGNPLAENDAKIVSLGSEINGILSARIPLLAVCLSHQILCHRLGLDIVRRAVPNQGVQREIDLFGRLERVGFYNTFAAYSAEDKIEVTEVGLVEVSRNPETGEIHALRGPGFASMQFHAESLLTVDGPRILGESLLWALGR